VTDRDKALENMPEKTGKTLEAWIEILDNKQFEKYSMAVSYLKTEHGVKLGFANTIVTLSKKQNETPV